MFPQFGGPAVSAAPTAVAFEAYKPILLLNFNNCSSVDTESWFPQ